MNFEEFCKERYTKQAYDFGDTYNCFGYRGDNTSDISAHLPVLELFAMMSESVTEFGTRDCYSTCAFIRGCKDVRSYDINKNNNVETLKGLVGDRWKFTLADTADPNFTIEQTDFLFIDTLHTYEQVKKELLQAKYVNKFIGFHDTVSQGIFSRDIPGVEGINRAINEFLVENPEWRVVYEVPFNHGLVVISKVDSK